MILRLSGRGSAYLLSRFTVLCLREWMCESRELTYPKEIYLRFGVIIVTIRESCLKGELLLWLSSTANEVRGGYQHETGDFGGSLVDGERCFCMGGLCDYRSECRRKQGIDCRQWFRHARHGRHGRHASRYDGWPPGKPNWHDGFVFYTSQHAYARRTGPRNAARHDNPRTSGWHARKFYARQYDDGHARRFYARQHDDGHARRFYARQHDDDGHAQHDDGHDGPRVGRCR